MPCNNCGGPHELSECAAPPPILNPSALKDKCGNCQGSHKTHECPTAPQGQGKGKGK